MRAAKATASSGVTAPLVSIDHRQLVVVGDLADAGVLDLVGDLADRREDGVDRDQADRAVFGAVLRGGDIALAVLDGQFHLERGALVERADHQIRVHDLDVMAGLDHAGGHFAGPLKP